MNYNMKICHCGRIHMVPMNKLDNAVDNDKDLLVICGNCGAMTIMGADVQSDGNYMYSHDIKAYDDNVSITSEIFTQGFDVSKPISEIFYDRGLKLPMMTGNYADIYGCGNFYDTHSNNPVNASTIHFRRFVRENKDKLDQLKELSYYVIPQLEGLKDAMREIM